jgi:hypothetical protein
MLTRIEMLLLENGFECISGGFGYSSISNVYSTFSNGNFNVEFGLNEKGHSPTLINPRPTIRYSSGNNICERLMSDSEVSGWLQNSDDKEILKFINKEGLKSWINNIKKI